MEHGGFLPARALAKIERAFRVSHGADSTRSLKKKPAAPAPLSGAIMKERRGPSRFDHARGVAFAWAPAI